MYVYRALLENVDLLWGQLASYPVDLSLCGLAFFALACESYAPYTSQDSAISY